MEAIEKQFDGMISIDQEVKFEIKTAQVGIRFEPDNNKIWICLDGESLIRIKPNPFASLPVEGRG